MDLFAYFFITYLPQKTISFIMVGILFLSLYPQLINSTWYAV